MKAVQIYTYGGNEVVAINTNVPKPIPSENQVLVEMRAAGVNPVDWKIREGYLQQIRPLNFPITLGMDFAGIVVAVGKKVTGCQQGDEVYGMSNIFSGGTGAFSEFLLVDANCLALKPKNLTHAEAAALPMAGVSALQALMDYIVPNQGKKILIHGAAGGIGTFAIQIAKYLGLYVATTVSESSKQFVKMLGADESIDYKNQKFENVLSDYDAVLDTIGGETYIKSFKVLKKGGIIVSMIEEPNFKLMAQYGVSAVIEFTDANNERLLKLGELVENNIIKVHLAKIFPLEQTKQALEYLQRGHPQGKIVVVNY